MTATDQGIEFAARKNQAPVSPAEAYDRAMSFGPATGERSKAIADQLRQTVPDAPVGPLATLAESCCSFHRARSAGRDAEPETAERDLDDREWLTVLAHRTQRFHNLNVDADLESVSPLRGLALEQAFTDLREALDERDGLADGSLSWVDTHPDLCGYDRDGQALDAASVRVEDALDALLIPRVARFR